MHYFSNLFLIKNSTCFGQIYCPSSGVSTLYTQQQVFVIHVMLTASEVRMDLTSLADSQLTSMTNTYKYCCVYSVETPDDGQ